MNEQTKFKKLGVPNFFDTKELIVDQTAPIHSDLKNSKIDIINEGTLRSSKPGIIVRTPVEMKNNTSIYEEYKVSMSSKNFYVEKNLEIPLFGQLSFYNPSKKYYGLISNNYFNSFLSYYKDKRNINFPGADVESPFVRLSFSDFPPTLQTQSAGSTSQAEVLSSNILNGFYNKKGVNYPISAPDLSQESSNRLNKNFLVWKKSNLPGETLNVNAENFYISYPNTVSVWNYNRYNVPVKITSFAHADNREDLEGILLISTGLGNAQKICYVSPHKAITGHFNTLVWASKIKKTVRNYRNGSLRPQPLILREKIPSGITVRGMIVGSEYQNNKIFPNSGVRVIQSGDLQINQVYSRTEAILNGLVRKDKFYPQDWNRPYTLSLGDHLKQDVPIKDTAFYQMYKYIYTGNKTFNTGVWNGIIPSGVPFQIELIQNVFNKKAGTENVLYPVYANYGSFDQNDTLIYESLSSFNVDEEKNTIAKTNVKVTDNKTLFSVGRGKGGTSDAAEEAAITNLKYIVFNKFSNIIKNNIPYILFLNRKLKKFLNFTREYRNRYFFNEEEGFDIYNSSVVSASNNSSGGQGNHQLQGGGAVIIVAANASNNRNFTISYKPNNGPLKDATSIKFFARARSATGYIGDIIEITMTLGTNNTFTANYTVPLESTAFEYWFNSIINNSTVWDSNNNGNYLFSINYTSGGSGSTSGGQSVGEGLL